MIALAKLRGLKTINLARDDSTFAELIAAGAERGDENAALARVGENAPG